MLVHKTRIRILLISLLSTTFAVTTVAQATGGSGTGTVLDRDGGAIPNATVTLRNSATGQTLVTQTTEAGSYTFPNVPVGDYTITIQSTGFAPATQQLRIALNQESGVDVSLQVGAVTGQVEVTAAGEALVQTESSQLGRSFETRQVQDLPIFGDQKQLALLAPNVVQQSAGTAGEGWAVGGVRARYNNFNVDGIDNNDPSITGEQIPLIQDAIQEFSLLTNNFNAEFGTAGGGQFNTVTRSGTNDFHGSCFLYVQNQSLNAASTAEERQLLKPNSALKELPRYRDARYGATLGGPIMRNRLFFFGALQREHNAQSAAGVSFLAPTAAGLQQIAALPGASPFVVNLLRENLELAPAATTTQSVLGSPVPFGFVTLNTPVGFNDDVFHVNLDHLPNTKDQFRYRFLYGSRAAEQAGFGSNNFNNLSTRESRLFSATWVRTFSPSVVNDLRLSYRRALFDFPLRDPAVTDFPNITVVPLGLQIGPGSNLPQDRFDNSYQLFDAVSYLRGPHTFKVGGEFRRLISSGFFLPRARGDYRYTTFDELITDANPTNFARRGLGNGTFTGNQSKYYGFVQDDWKVTPGLTLNLGVRYEYNTLPRDVKLQALNSPASVPGVIEFRVPETDKDNWAPRVGLAYAPAFEGGLLRRIFGERGTSSLRLNAGIAYSEVFQNLPLLNAPPQIQQSEVSLQQSARGLGYNIEGRPFLATGGIPNTVLPLSDAAAARLATGVINADNISPETYSFTVSFQRELTPTTAVELRYLGTRSRHLPIQVQRNAGLVNENALTIPTFLSAPGATHLAGLPALGTATSPVAGTIRARSGVGVQALAAYGFGGFATAYDPIGNSQYDGGSISVTRRFSRGLAFTAAYTFSKTIDDSTNELNTSAVNPRRPQNPFNIRDERSLSSFDIPHRFAASINYEVSVFNRSRYAFVRTALGGWQFNTIFQAQSGQPVTPISGVDSNLNFDTAGDRAILNPQGAAGVGSGIYAVNAAGTRIVNARGADVLGDATTVAYVAIDPRAQYIQAGPGARATAGRNTLRSSGFNRTDAVLLKNFRFGEERYNLQVGAEISNLFNQRVRAIADFGTIFSGDNPNLRAGLGVVNTPFNLVASPLFNSYGTADFSGRVAQIRAKFIF